MLRAPFFILQTENIMSEQVKVGLLPTGRFDENDEEIRIPVCFAVPTRALNNMAYELTKSSESKGDDALMIAAAQSQLRVCLRSIDGVAVNTVTLQHSKLDGMLSSKQQDILLTALMDYTTASEGMVNACYTSVRSVADGSKKHMREANLPTGELDEERKPITRPITFELPNRKILARAAEQSSVFKGRSRIMVASERELNILRFTITKIGGRAVSVEDLRGDGIDELLTQKEQSCISQVLKRLTEASGRESEDFLDSIVDASKLTAPSATSTNETSTASPTMTDS